MLSLIPANYRLLAAVIAVLALCAMSAAGGAVVATWKAEAGFSGERQKCASEQTALRGQMSEQALAIEKQNGAIALLKSEGKAAQDAKKVAEAFAAQMAAFSKGRMDKLQAALAQSCGDVTRNYWELRR